MKKILLVLSLLITSTSFASQKYLFNMYFSINYKNATYKYLLNFYQGQKGLVVKSKMNGIENTHYIQTEGKQYTITRTPKDLIDKPLFYMYRLSQNKYKIQYPINMNDSNWDKISFTVENGEAISTDGYNFTNIKVGKVVFDRYWGLTVPVGVSHLEI